MNLFNNYSKLLTNTLFYNLILDTNLELQTISTYTNLYTQFLYKVTKNYFINSYTEKLTESKRNSKNSSKATIASIFLPSYSTSL